VIMQNCWLLQNHNGGCNLFIMQPAVDDRKGYHLFCFLFWLPAFCFHDGIFAPRSLRFIFQLNW